MKTGGSLFMLTLDKIYHAAFTLKDVVRKTDLIEAPKLRGGQSYLFKNGKLASDRFVQGAWRVL